MGAAPNACDFYRVAYAYGAPALIPPVPLALFAYTDAPVLPHVVFVTTGTIADLERQLFPFVRDDPESAWTGLNDHEEHMARVLGSMCSPP